MPDFLTIKRQHDAAKSKGLVPADSSIADFARMGALATDDPSYQQVAESPAWKNMIRSWSAAADEAIQSGPVDDWTAEAFGAVGDVFGVTPKASRAAGRELPRQVLNFLPMMAGGAIGALGGPAGAATGAKIGLGLTSGLSALDAYGKGGTTLDAVIGGVSPYLGGKLSELGSKAALRSAATPGSFLNKAGFMKGKDFLNPATHTIKDPVTGVAKQVLGETVDTFRDKALGYMAGEAVANIGFTGLDLIQQGPDAVLNRDYLFANLASNIPFALADLPNFTKTRFAWEPTDAPLRPTQDQINAEKTRAERTRESLDAVDNHLARFNKELELGVDVGRFIEKNNQVAATMEGHRAAIKLEAENFQNTWNQLRTVKETLPDVLTGIDPAVLLKDPSVISFDPAKALVQEYAQKLKQINKVKGGNLSRIAKSDADLDTVMGLVEEDLKLPETLLSTPVEQRTVEQYQKALGTKLSDNAIKLIRMKHMELAQGERFVPEFPKLWEEYNNALTGKFKGSLDDRYELITASLLATGKFPKVVKAQKKAVKEARAEGQTNAEANKNATGKMATLSKAEKRAAAKAKRAAEKAADALNPPAPKNKGGAPKGPRKSTVAKVDSMEERILFAAKALEPTDNERFLLIANQLINPDPAVRLKSLSWMQKVADEHADLPLAQKLAKFQSGLKTIEGRVEQSNEVQTVPLREEVTPDPFISPGEQADIDAAVAERKMVETDAVVKAMDELIVEESVREFEEDGDGPSLSESPAVKERDLLLKFLSALGKKRGSSLPADEALMNVSRVPGARDAMLKTAKAWEEKGFPQLAASDIDPLTVHFTTGQPLPIREFALAWAREAGVPEAEIPAVVEDFVRITQMFSAGEARFGKLEGQMADGAQFARASAGAFDFGMREVRNGQLQRPGKPPLGTKDGWMPELDFRNNAGDVNGVLTKDEVNFYRELVPEAFKDGKVHLQKLWDGLGKVGEQVKVVTYGQKIGNNKKAEFDRLAGELDILGIHIEADLENGRGFIATRNGQRLSYQDQRALPAATRRLIDDASVIVSDPGYDPLRQNKQLSATAHYNQISPFDTKKFPVLRVDVVLPEKHIPFEEYWKQLGFDSPTSYQGKQLTAEQQASLRKDYETKYGFDKKSTLWPPDNLHENLPNTLGWAMVQIVPHPVTGEKVMFVGEAQSRWAQDRRKLEGRGMAEKMDASPNRDRIGGYAPGHPLLPIHQNLILKSVIKEAQKQGIKKVAISDGETAMMTERHDKGLTEGRALGGSQSFATEVEAKAFAEQQETATIRNNGNKYLPWSVEYRTKAPRPTQEGGMRLAYDTTMPSIMSKLVGEGKVEDFGVHKNARKNDTDFDERTRPIINVRENKKLFGASTFTLETTTNAPQQRNWVERETFNSKAEAEAAGQQLIEQWDARMRAALIPGSPVFRNPDGTPKTNATARVFDISNPSDRVNTLFARGGTQAIEVWRGESSGKDVDVMANKVVWLGSKELAQDYSKDGKAPTKYFLTPKRVLDYKNTQEFESVVDAFAGEMANLYPHQMPAAFVKRVVLNGTVTDYHSLKPGAEGSQGRKRLLEDDFLDFVRNKGYDAVHRHDALDGHDQWISLDPKGNLKTSQEASAERGGTIYGAAFKDIAQAYFSTKAFQGPNKTKAMGYVLAHEMGHIAFGKAMRGEYGPETKQLFDEAIAWVKTNDPAVLRDVEEVIRDLYLPKEMRNLDGVRDVLGNTDGEEWMANAHAMMVTGAMQANKPVKALLILPKVLRNAVENTIRRIQDGLKHARMYWKLSGDKDKMNQVLRVKAMVDSVRGKFREAEWQTAQAHKFFDIDPAGLMGRMEDAQFARSPYPVEGVKQRVGNWFNNATQGLGGFMATYRSFIEPGFRLLNSGNVVTEQVTESLTPIFGHKGAVDNIVVDKSMPWYKISSSPPLLDLTKRINLEAQDSSVSAIVQNPDGTVSFNWNAMSPEHRAEVKLYSEEQQRNVAMFLMQKEQSTRLTQKHNVEHETNRARMFTVNLVSKLRSFDQGAEPALRHKEARVVAERLFDGLKSGDQVAVQEALSRFADPREAQKLVEIIQEKQGVLSNLEKHYANSPNFQSLRRFKPVIQRYTNPAGESKVLDFNKGSEALAMRKELEAKGWKAVGDPIIRDNDKKYRGEFTLDSKVVDLLQGKEGRLKDLIDSINLDPADRDSLLGESTFLADVLREAKSNDIYLPGVKRRVSGGPEHLDMLEQHLTYTQAAHKVGYMTALGEELKYHMNNPELKDQLREKTQFMEFYKQAKESDPKFWRIVNKSNAVWHIGFNLPGHLAELFQPIQTHIHEAVYQGHSMLTALRTTVKAEKDAMAVIGKLIKSKIGYHDEAALWEKWGDKDEADMLRTNWRRSLTQPLQEVYQQVGVNQETLRAIAQERTMPSVSKTLLKPLNMYSNAAMGVYSVFTQHNNLVGLLTGYRLAKKKGLSHEEAVKSAALFELTANNSGGRTERPVYFGKLGSAGYLVYALSSYVRGRFTDLARYYRHGFDRVNFPELEQSDRRAARKAFATMISGQLAAAGLLGFPFIGAGISLMEDLTGDEIKGSGMAALNEMTDDPLLTQALSYGVFSSMAESLGIPADLHSRFSLGGYLGVNAYDGISASSVLGPTASMVNSMWKMGKSFTQEKDLGAALRAGGPGGIKKLAEALSEEFQGQNPDANLPLAMAGFRSGKMFRQKEMERIISKTNEAAQRDITVAAKRVEESLMLGPEIAQATLMREANQLIDQNLEGRGRQVALRDMMQSLRQRIATAKVKAQMPTDIRGKATAQTASKVSSIAQAVGYTPPPAGNMEQEQILRSIYNQLGGQRSVTSLRNAARRQAELDASPGTFY